MSFTTYERYKRSGLGWLGDVPEHWEVVPVRAVVAHLDERNENAACQAYLSLLANVGVIPYEEKGDIGNKKPDDLSKCKRICVGDIVINSMNYSIGSYGISSYDGVCSPVYVVLRANEAIVQRRFAFRIFQNVAFQRYAASFGNGILAHRAAINWDDLKGIGVALPPAEEQVGILSFLDSETAKIDALIEEQRRLIELLKEKRQAVISHVVTWGLNPEATMTDSGVDWLVGIPEHWEVVPLGYLVQLHSGGTPNKANQIYWDGSIPWVSPKDMKVEELADSQDHISEVAVEQTRLTVFSPNHVLLVVRGMILAHTVPVTRNSVPVTINQDMKAVRCGDRLEPAFLQYLFTGLNDLIVSLASESAHGTLKLETPVLTHLPIPVPPREEQVQICSKLAKAKAVLDDLIITSGATISLLTERRSSLISAAVTGKIDVRHWTPTEATA